MPKTIRLAPSVLSADFGRLGDDLKSAEKAGADLIHVDVMDGHFVPNITIGPPVVAAIKRYTTLPLDVHLMIENPEAYIDDFIAAGASCLTIHAEATAHAHRCVEKIKGAGVLAGISINPGTPVGALDSIIKHVDLVLIMSVNPGFGGQAFIPSSIEKIQSVSRLIDSNRLDVQIEVDGGITTSNATEVIQAGADILVAGSAVFGTADIARAINSFGEIFDALV